LQDQPHPPRRTGALRGRDTSTVSINSAFPSGEPQGPLPPHPRPVGTTPAEASPRQEAEIRSATAQLIPVQKSALLTRQTRREAQHASETILRADLCMEVVGTRGPVRRAGRCAGRMAGNWLVPRAGRSTSTRKARRRLASRRRTPRGSPPGVHPLAGVVSKSGISQRGRGRLPPRAGELSGTLATAAQLVPSRMGRAPSTSLGAPAARIVTATAALRRPPPGADQAR
jgi:hypothetical protein